MMEETAWKVFTERGQTYRMKAQYGMDYAFAQRNNQSPYFSITMTQERRAGNGRWMEDSGGAAHEAIARRFSNLAPYIKWHLVSSDSPMHYLANAKYWWEIATGKMLQDKYSRSAVNPWEAFKRTVVFGGLPTDAATIPPMVAPGEDFLEWLQGRLPALMETFQHAMKTLGVWEG